MTRSFAIGVGIDSSLDEEPERVGLAEQARVHKEFSSLWGVTIGPWLHKCSVELQHPTQAERWPCTGGCPSSVYMTAADTVVTVLRGHSNVRKIGRVEWLDLQPADEQTHVERHLALRKQLQLADRDVVIEAPIRVITSDAKELLREWSLDDQQRIATHCMLNLRHNCRHLGLASDLRAPTEDEIEEAVTFIFAGYPPAQSESPRRRQTQRHCDTTAQVHHLQSRLKLEQTGPENASSIAARSAATDMRKAKVYCKTLVDQIPEPSKRRDFDSVRDYLLLVHEWSNFLLAGVVRFIDHVEEEWLGGKSAPHLLQITNNALRLLYAGIGVQIQSVVYPRAFAESAEEWTPLRRREVMRAVSTTRRRLQDLVLGEMDRFVPFRPPLSALERAIADLVFSDGPLTGTAIVEALPARHQTGDSNVRRIFGEKLIRYYGFVNPRDGTGYHAPVERTW